MLLKKLKKINVIKINGIVNSRSKEILFKHPIVRKELFNITSFLISPSLAERIYCLLNNRTTIKRCKNCNKPTAYNKNTKLYRDYCSTKCLSNSKDIQTRRVNTSRERYGDYNNRKKVKETWKTKSQEEIDNIVTSRRRTKLKRHGDKNYTNRVRCRTTWNNKSDKQIQEHVNKNKQSKLENRGNENYNNKQQIKETKLERYGNENYNNKKQIKETWNNKSQEEINNINKKRENTIFKRYNRNFPHQNHISKDSLIKLDNKIWLYYQHYILKKPLTQIGYELCVHETTVGDYLHKHNIITRQVTGFSYKAITWLEYIMETENIYIQHALNNGEYHIKSTRYHVDGYCKENNTVYEFLGDIWHGNIEVINENEYRNYFNPEKTAKQLYEETMDRLNEIQLLGYNVVYLWENDLNI